MNSISDFQPASLTTSPVAWTIPTGPLTCGAVAPFTQEITSFRAIFRESNVSRSPRCSAVQGA